MYNERNIKIVKRGIVLVMFLIGMLTGAGIVLTIYSRIAPQIVSTAKTEEKEAELDQETVKKFLIAYYTKKDLGENRNRYSPLMTPAMYKQQVDQEDLPVNQAYKGYVLNQVFDNANVYIDESRLMAIATVNYTNLQVLNKNGSEGTNINNTESVLISFSKDKGKYLVSNLEKINVSSLIDERKNNRYSNNKIIKSDDKEHETSATNKETTHTESEKETTTKEVKYLQGGLNLDEK